ncbi:protein D3 [Bemisia tabaci]|uniref:protein D3 n=1 Tax=Bemisia tabaci TaxID=7038 RepID=UPI003B288E39
MLRGLSTCFSIGFLLLLIVFRVATLEDYGQFTTPEERAQLYFDVCIVPEIIKEPPKHVLLVNFSTTNYIPRLGLNGVATREEIAVKPDKIYFEADPYKLYSLFELGTIPKLLNPLLKKQVLHWFVCNIPGYQLLKGDTGAFYIPSTPVTAFEVYVYKFLIFLQPGPINCTLVQQLLGLLGRLDFSVTDYAEKHNLTGPLAGNFYECCWPFQTLGLVPLPVSNETVNLRATGQCDVKDALENSLPGLPSLIPFL